MVHTHHMRTSVTVLAVSLVVGVATTAAGPAFADDLGEVATSTFSYSSVDTTSGIIVGGVPRVFDPAHDGWRSEAFSEFGRFGLERKIDTELSERNQFSAWNESVTIEQGATTSMVLSSHIITDSLTRNIVESTITMAGNSLRHSVRLTEMWAGSLPRMRFYLFADLAAGSSVRYEQLSPAALLATDASGNHPSVLMHVSASDGDAFFASRDDHEQPLSNGDPLATAYVGSISGTASTITLHTFLIDSDPCADNAVRELATTIAADPAAYFGQALETPSSCLSGNAWEILSSSEQPQNLSIDVDERVTTPPGSTRRFSLGGLPSFLTGTVDDSASPATISVDFSSEASVGDYPVTLSSWLDTTTGGVTTRSQPMTQLVTLAIREPAPEPEPEPDVTPEIVGEPVAESPLIAVSNEDAPRREKKKADIVAVELAPAPAPPSVPSLSVTGDAEAEEESAEPDFQLQESAPATPLPEDPPRSAEAAAVDLAKPTTNIWSTWWLWVLGGLSLLWWGWLGWSARNRPAEQGM
ncbi:MAG: hypothetical protein ACO39R_03785 [Pontimonas sp.]